MKDYLDMIAKHADFDSVILSLTMDDGFSVSYRKRKGILASGPIQPNGFWILP